MTDEQRVRRLLDRLMDPEGDPDRPFDVDPARYVPGWWVARDLTDKSRNLWCYITPADRPKAVPWAVPPAHRAPRRELVEVLRELWVPDALAWLAERE